jgi:hypothetical protein
MMQKHLTDGELRAALDGELEPGAPASSGCARCQARQQQFRLKQLEAARMLAFWPPKQTGPVCHSAWDRFSQQIMQQKEISMTKRWFSFPLVRFGTAALVLLMLVLAFPGTRALAGELLNLFRVQQVRWFPWTSPAWSS